MKITVVTGISVMSIMVLVVLFQQISDFFLWTEQDFFYDFFDNVNPNKQLSNQ